MKLATTLILMIVLPGLAMAQGQKNFIDQNFIEVQGTAIVRVAPDLIYLRIRIAEKQKNRADLLTKESKMLSKLKWIGIDSEQVLVKDMASNFRPVLFSDEDIILSKEYLVCVHDVKTANSVITEMEALKISNITVDRLDHTSITDFKKDCSVNAMIAAKSKADALTQAINQSIGQALYIEEQLSDIRANVFESGNTVHKAEIKTSSSWNVSDLAFDEIKLECVILARFEIK